jgi:hypothetical protein
MHNDRLLEIILSDGRKTKAEVVITKINLTEREILDIFWKHKYMPGRCLGSKSGNHRLHPDHFFVFNSNIVISSYGKVWWGDVDATDEAVTLKNIANDIGSDLYILGEHDGRWGMENSTVSVLMNKARLIVKCDKNKQKR